MNKVLGIAGNKCDIFEEEKVDKKEVEIFANEIGASFQLTSAQSNTGIKELFTDLGRQFLLSYKNKEKNINLDVESKTSNEHKSGCC